MAGGTSFTFVQEGIEAALELAREAAGERDVTVSGGATTARQYLAAGRLFDDPSMAGTRLEQTRVAEGPGVTHLEYRVR
jgi:hypothetical protein